MKYLASLAVLGFVAIMAMGPGWLVFITLWLLLSFPVAVFAGHFIKGRTLREKPDDLEEH